MEAMGDEPIAGTDLENKLMSKSVSISKKNWDNYEQLGLILTENQNEECNQAYTQLVSMLESLNKKDFVAHRAKSETFMEMLKHASTETKVKINQMMESLG
ncbi:MAG: hypothetical protein U5L45_04655 [Saprospiraceae bacterium]|nr:hypothetical protein [Saprospiraceae bacterium]